MQFIKRFINDVNQVFEAKSKIDKMDRRQLKKYLGALQLVEKRGKMKWNQKMIIGHTRERLEKMGY